MLIERNEEGCWWELQARAKQYRYCTRRRVEGFDYPTDMPTGWVIMLRMSGDWLAKRYGASKTVVGTLEEAKQFVEVSFALERAND